MVQSHRIYPVSHFFLRANFWEWCYTCLRHTLWCACLWVRAGEFINLNMAFWHLYSRAVIFLNLGCNDIYILLRKVDIILLSRHNCSVIQLKPKPCQEIRHGFGRAINLDSIGICSMPRRVSATPTRLHIDTHSLSLGGGIWLEALNTVGSRRDKLVHSQAFCIHGWCPYRISLHGVVDGRCCCSDSVLYFGLYWWHILLWKKMLNTRSTIGLWLLLHSAFFLTLYGDAFLNKSR